MHDEYKEKDITHDFYIRVSGLWQKLGAKHYNDFTSTDRFSFDVRDFESTYRAVTNAFKGLNVTNEDIESLLNIVVTRGDGTTAGASNDG